MNEIKIKAVDSGKIKDYRKEVLISIEEYNQYCDACKQLQAYKNKENKMKHYVHTLFFENHFEKEEQFKKCKKEILQILNEGE